jgi:3-phenylpropionate/trans-cinnamate dioxygenase ferredoxin reductase component
MTAAGTLIVGAGQAGHTMALTLRRCGYAAPVTVVGAEPHQPYQRPPLSKAFLLGTTDVERLALGRPNVFPEAGIDLVLGERITSITAPAPGTPGHAATDRGRVFDFDQVGLAVGGEPRRLDLPGSDLAGIHYLRTLADAHALRSSMTNARRVVVIGGGFIGLETAAAARSTGASVTVLEATERLLSRVVAPVVSDAYAAAHRRRGADIRLNSSAVAFDGEDAVRAVVLADGSSLAADLVLVGIGMRPRLELARQLGLRCEQGIVVDEAARTSNPLVCAAGDCTQFPDPRAPGRVIMLESVQNAMDQARVAAAALAGQPTRYGALPWFWSDQGSLKLQIAGLSHGYEDLLVVGNPDDERFAILYFRAGLLTAIDAVNLPLDYAAVRRALARGDTLGREMFAPDLAPAEILS